MAFLFFTRRLEAPAPGAGAVKNRERRYPASLCSFEKKGILKSSAEERWYDYSERFAAWSQGSGYMEARSSWSNTRFVVALEYPRPIPFPWVSGLKSSTHTLWALIPPDA